MTGDSAEKSADLFQECILMMDRFLSLLFLNAPKLFRYNLALNVPGEILVPEAHSPCFFFSILDGGSYK